MNLRKVLAVSLLAPAFLTPGAGALISQRHGHTSTLLPDGNILIVGGTFNTATVQIAGSVEMYDMATSTYVPWLGNLATARSSHTATLMSDGRVLIAGGFGSSGVPLNSLEICNPITRTCAAPGFGDTTMLTARGGHTATLLSVGARTGQVLLCGGQFAASSATITGNCETFDPVLQTRAAAGAMVSPRIGHAATLLRSGRVFVTGGARAGAAGSQQWIYEPMNEMYDPSTGPGVWTPVSALLQGRVNHTATVLNNGKIMIVGGYNSTNALYCQGQADSLDDECWHIKYDKDNVQDAGNHGYLDGAEFFDQNGARVVLAETTYGEIPYRVAQHSAALLHDGGWRMHGGYGNIVPTFFISKPTLTPKSIIYLSSTGYHDATINNTSIIEFPLTFPLSRPVSGRLVDADIFISSHAASVASSIEVENAKFHLGSSTAPADAAPVGLLVGETAKPGDFKGTVRLQNPAGTAEFSKQTVNSGVSPFSTTMLSSVLVITIPPLYPAEYAKRITGTMQAGVSLTVPSIYRNISGRASITDGRVVDSLGVSEIILEQTGSATFYMTTPASCQNDTCVFTDTIYFTGLTGTISNLTTLAAGTTVYNSPPPAIPPGGADVNATAGDTVTLTLELDYNAMEVSILDKKPTFNFEKSTVVVRGMIFSNQLGYTPKSNSWGDLTNKDDFPAMETPSFNHTALLTPAADTVILGGRNCEFNPEADCRRTAMRFSTAAVATIFIPVYKGLEGTDTWSAGDKLRNKRAFHTSTMLPDGSILTCGGSDGTKPLAICERLDPLTKKWGPAGPMNSPRANHTATLLPNGNVLAVGGITPDGIAVSSAEIFYPDTQRWVPTTSMASPRQLHTATLMPDGNVLVVGGATLSTYSATAEIYISSTSYWQTVLSPMVNGRSQHTATLLKNGNVLVAGGVNGLGAMKQAEIYNYLTRTFSPAAADLTYARYAHTTTLLRDGNVVVLGGSDGIDSLATCEIYNGAAWTEPKDETGKAAELFFNRANHRSVLLPNGKIMVTGGEMRGAVQTVAESFGPDFRNWSAQKKTLAWTTQGRISARTHHTSVITRDNRLINIGGWDGGKYLDNTEYTFLVSSPDVNGLEAETARKPVISTGTVYFDQASTVTLLSGASNFHGITEASGGGAGSANASFHNPRIYLQQMDNPSGFITDLSTRIYSLYGGVNANWEKTLSSITVIMPAAPGELPHGWYHMRVAAAGLFSDGHAVQVTVPRPDKPPSVPTGAVLGTSSITWTWTQGLITAADGYNLYSSTDNLFIATAAFTASPSYTQTGLAPNTAASIKVSAYNLGGGGPLSKSATYYTYAAAPTPLNITAASFETANLEWTRNSNSVITTYEVSMSPTKPTPFSSAVDISTPVPFSVNYLSTSTVIRQLSANQPYDFRVSAKNGDGIITAFTNYATTITVSGVNNFTGVSLGSSAVNWSWDEAPGATYYELYDVINGTTPVIVMGSTTANNFSQSGLAANRRYRAAVSAVNDTTGFGPIRGPTATARLVYTHTVQPLPATPNIFTNVSTGSFTVNWIINGNSTWTVYRVAFSTGGVQGVHSSFSTVADSIFLDKLSPNISHHVMLTPVNGDGIAGTAVDLGTKYTRARVPASLTTKEVTMSGIKLAWDTDGNSPETIYEVRSSTNENFSEPVTAFVKFQDFYTARQALANGLLTSTTYYFDVAGRNQELIVTARKRAPAAVTLNGPDGAPAGSVGGTSHPKRDVTISGALPTGRIVTMGIPAGSFAAETSIAVSSSANNYCGYTVGGKPIEVTVYSQDKAQPQTPVTLALNYDSAESAAAIDANRQRMVLARYNSVSGQCLPLETVIDTGLRTITATLNHFSIFQLIVRTASPSLSNLRVYPNPFYPNRGQGFVTMDNVPPGAKVRIYTLSGDKVWEGTAATTSILVWKGVNKSGGLVASGIYLAVIDSSVGKKVVKLAVER